MAEAPVVHRDGVTGSKPGEDRAFDDANARVHQAAHSMAAGALASADGVSADGAIACEAR